MRLAFVLEPLTGLDPSVDSTVGLMEAAQRRGHDVWVCQARELASFEGRAHAPLRRVHLTPAVREAGRFVLPSTWYSVEESTGWLPLDAMDGVFCRTVAPLDSASLHVTYVLDLVAAGTTVVNSPRGVRLAHEKLFALQFPELVPPTIVTADPSVVIDFVRRCGRAVLKPVDGHAVGRAVELRPDDSNLRALVALGTADGRLPVVVQACIDGDSQEITRMFVVDGEPLAAVVCLPDGAVELASVTDSDRAMVARLAPALRRHGLWLVSLDVIDGRLMEVNVTNPGAIRTADAALGTHLAEDVVARFEWLRRTMRPLATAALRER